MSDQTSRHPVLTGAFLLLLVIGLGFGAHAVWSFSTRVLSAEAPRVEGWMTPRHVMAVFNLPRDDLAPILGLAEDETPFATLNDLAAERGLAPDVLLQQVQDAVDQAGGGRMIAELYALIPRHGASVLFVAALLSCAGIPIPTSALMLAAGAFVASGDMQFLPVALTTLVGAIIGDQIGYGAGRVGGQPLWDRFRAKPKFTALMDRARDELDNRAVIAVILSRFPLSALGPWINLASGATRIAWHRFTLGVLVGDTVWILAYLGTGAFFAHKAKALGTTMTSAVIALTALAAAVWLGRQLWVRRRRHAA